jgi:hypothetical protein
MKNLLLLTMLMSLLSCTVDKLDKDYYITGSFESTSGHNLMIDVKVCVDIKVTIKGRKTEETFCSEQFMTDIDGGYVATIDSSFSQTRSIFAEKVDFDIKSVKAYAIINGGLIIQASKKPTFGLSSINIDFSVSEDIADVCDALSIVEGLDPESVDSHLLWLVEDRRELSFEALEFLLDNIKSPAVQSAAISTYIDIHESELSNAQITKLKRR